MWHLLKLFLPTLIPSWRFFEDIGPSARIEYRIWHSGVPTEWHAGFGRPVSLTFAEVVRRLFWNADWNDYLFITTCAERLILDPTQHATDQINAWLIHRFGLAKTRLQFRLVFLQSANDTGTIEHQSDPVDVI